MTEPSPPTFRPMSSKELAIKAQDFDFNPFIPLKFWIRTSETLLREALIYQQERNDQQAYLLFMRYAALVAERFPLHPSFKDPEYKLVLNSIKKNLPTVLDSMEVLKPRINSRYNAWHQSEHLADIVSQKLNNVRRTTTDIKLSPSDPAIAGNISTLAAAENRELAVKIAQEEINRRSKVRRINSPVSSPRYDSFQEKSTELLGNLNLEPVEQDDDLHDESRSNIQESGKLLANLDEISFFDSDEISVEQNPIKLSTDGKYPYPTVAKPRLITYEFEQRRSPELPISLTPNRPPKKPFQSEISNTDIPPPRPQKFLNALDPPTPPESNVPSYTFRPSSYLENGNPLRTIFLPVGLRSEFLKYAQPNTRKNLETCGMLCGTLISNALFIRQVVIPEQESTCDTCETTNEGALFDYCDKEDLLVLGWIHTHPTQTCFMSSRDLHTQCGYQIMMPESIAIVCAPSKIPSWGVFRLTDPPGLGSVLNCTHTGLFHPHSETNLYTSALRPGHVVETEDNRDKNASSLLNSHLEVDSDANEKNTTKIVRRRRKKCKEDSSSNLPGSTILKTEEQAETTLLIDKNEKNPLTNSPEKRTIKPKRKSRKLQELTIPEEKFSNKPTKVGRKPKRSKVELNSEKIESKPEHEESTANTSETKIEEPNLCGSESTAKDKFIHSLNLVHQKIRSRPFEEDQKYEIRDRIDLVDDKLCAADDVLERLMPSLEKYKGCNLIDLNPGACLWSSKLHDALQPQKHLLVEPHSDGYMPFLKPLLEKVDSKYQLIKRNGMNWSHLEAILTPENFPEQQALDVGDPILEQINNRILVTANIASHPVRSYLGFTSFGSLVVYQFLSAIRTSALFQKYGKVRMLLWINPVDGKIIPKNVNARKKSSLEATLSCQHIEYVVDADLPLHKRREKRLDIERATSVLENMKKNGVKIPDGRKTKILNAIEAGETGREIEELSPKCLQKELKDMENAFAIGTFEKDVTRSNPTMSSRLRKTRRSPEYLRLCDLTRRNNRQQSKTLLFLDLADKFEKILQLYITLRLTTDATKASVIENEIKDETLAYKAAMKSLTPIEYSAVQYLCDNRRIFNQKPPGLFWDRRKMEPMTAHEHEFYPNQVLSLVDLIPGFLPSVSVHPEFYDTLAFLTMQMCLVPSHSLKTALENMSPGADDWLVSECPSLTDPLKNGCPDLELISARCITSEMMIEMCEAWLRWPFRPHRDEILHRLGSEAFYDEPE
ncbi:hypothetical protein OnM2_056013 [Erysiphe neolycopersici]|uniref:MPN domain-containing protein n=1 Tax=Erysiphe neolycopersici TaxID=212602 RepID=A0A420HR11_9PEZI|nr:hypothetical protein OnM2_056013 [Erysiphe neolycopersici]